MTVRIYGVPRSRAFRALWCALECGIEFEDVPVGFDGATKAPDYTAINPNQRIPALVDGEVTLFESLAITLYLAKRYGGSLYPSTIAGEALAWQWSLWAIADLDLPAIAWANHAIVLPPGQRDPDQAAKALAKLEKPLAVLDRTLAGSPWLVGDAFGIADLNVAAVAYRLLWLDAKPPHVADWLERCYARPAAREARRLREG